MPVVSLRLPFKGAPDDHDTQICCLGPTLVNFGFFFYGWHVVAIQDPDFDN